MWELQPRVSVNIKRRSISVVCAFATSDTFLSASVSAKNMMAERRRRKKLNDRLYLLRLVVPKISKAGVKMADPLVDVFNRQEVEMWPCIIWKPKWAITYRDVKKKVHEGCCVSQRSTMILNGQNIFLDRLSLDGTIVINAISGAMVKVTGSVQNKGWTLKHIDYKDSSFPEEMQIRGFVIDKVEQLEMNYTEPGKFSLGS